MLTRLATLLLVALMALVLGLAARNHGGSRTATHAAQPASQEVANSSKTAAGLEPEPVPDTWPVPASNSPNAQIWKKLQAPISGQFADTPLADAVAAICNSSGVRYHFDKLALEEHGVSADTATVSLQLKDVPAEWLLELVLSQHQLVYAMRHGTIVVTTPNQAYRFMEVRTYPLADLIGPEGELADWLGDVIQYSIAPESWSRTGGWGKIETFGGVMIICQSSPIQSEIEALLRQIRQGLRVQSPRIHDTP